MKRTINKQKRRGGIQNENQKSSPNFLGGHLCAAPAHGWGAGDKAAGAVTAVRPPGLSGQLHIYTAVLCFALFEQDCLGDDRWTELPCYLAIKIFSPAKLI